MILQSNQIDGFVIVF